jgi:transcription elongation factor Elf1
MKFHCCVCGRQIVSYDCDSEHAIDVKGSKAGVKAYEVFCRKCGVDLDENGLFPEEREGY